MASNLVSMDLTREGAGDDIKKLRDKSLLSLLSMDSHDIDHHGNGPINTASCTRT